MNAVSPGPTSTPFHGKLGLSDADLDGAAAAVEAKVPLQRFGEADEIAKAVLFLASSDASFITGAGLVVDGGLTQIWAAAAPGAPDRGGSARSDRV